MTYIWNRETLWSLLQHHDEEIQDWAASRLLVLYPEATADLVEGLPRVSSSMASIIVMHIQGEASSPSLQAAWHTVANPYLKARVAALLLRAGHTLTADQLAVVEQGNGFDLLAETEPGFAFLLSRYREAPHEAGRLLRPLALACGSADIFVRLEEDTRKRAWRGLLDELEEAWGCSLSAYKGVRRAREAIRVLEQTLRTVPLEETIARQWQQELHAALAQDRQRLAAVAEAASSRLVRFPDLALAEVALILACVLALHRDVHCWTRLRDARDMTTVWQGITLRPWRMEAGQGFKDFLRGFAPGAVLSSLDTILSRPWTYTAHAFQLLNALEISGRFGMFLKVFRGQVGEQVAGEAEAALKAGGPSTAAFLLEQYRQQLPEPWELNALLADMPTPAVAEFLHEHFEHYMRHPDVKSFIEALETVASEHFLAPLRHEWRAGEPVLGRAITFLATLHGVEDQQIRQIRRDVAPQQRAFNRFKAQAEQEPDQAFQEMLEDSPFTLPLRCTACGRTYHYALQKVFVDPQQPSNISIGQIVQCKGCGSLETYEQTSATRLALTAEVLRLSLLAQQRAAQTGQRAQPPETPLILQRPQIMAAGRRFNTIREAYWFLREELQKHPESGDLHRRLGLILKNGAQPDLALPYLLKASALAPDDAEAYYNIIEILVGQERYREAIPHLETLIRLCREGEMDEQQRRDLFGGLLEQVVVLESKTKHRFELWPRLSPQAAGELAPGPPTVYLTSLDLSNPREFERAYQLFLTGALPEAPRQGALRSLWDAFSEAEAPAEDEAFVPPQPVRVLPKVGRNSPCPCGSGKKYKRCCGR
jgi:tetratricopeptide (TPR) repeat protein